MAETLQLYMFCSIAMDDMVEGLGEEGGREGGRREGKWRVRGREDGKEKGVKDGGENRKDSMVLCTCSDISTCSSLFACWPCLLVSRADDICIRECRYCGRED